MMKKALIVGINDYPDCPLSGCENDASGVAAILETNGDGSPNFDVSLRTNIKDKRSLKAAINDLFTGEVDTALFYFSGHGYLNELGGYIVTPDFKKYDEGVSMDEVLKYANQSKTRNKIIILDCCHSGAMADLPIQAASSIINEGTTILTACRNSEYAVEVDGHGVFTNLLISALQGGAANICGEITPGSIYSYIDQALGAWEQRPVFKTNVVQFVSLRTAAPRVALDILRKLPQYFETASNVFPLDPSFEDTNSHDVKHEIKEPYAVQEHVAIFKDLQALQSVGLVVPVGADFMYFAAMNSTGCKLTALGAHYWNLAKKHRI